MVTSAGGKALNVAGVLRALGEPVQLLGFFGGIAGDFLLRQAAAEGIDILPIQIASGTRTAVVLVEDDGVETEIVEPGGAVTADEIDALRLHLRAAATRAQVIVLAGSVPPGCPDDIYLRLLEDCCDADGRPHCPVILDTSRAWLRAVATPATGPRPAILKPNRAEAEELFGRRLRAPADIRAALDRLAAAGIDRPVISDGAAGLYAHAGREVLHVRPPRLRAVNSVGSGDAAVAGLAAGLVRGYDWPEMLALAAACGSANVLTKECAHVRADDVERLRARMRVRRLAKSRTGRTRRPPMDGRVKSAPAVGGRRAAPSA